MSLLRGLLDQVGDQERWLEFWRPDVRAQVWALKRRFDHARARSDTSERSWRKMMRVFNEWGPVALVTCNWNWPYIDAAAKRAAPMRLNKNPTKKERAAHDEWMRRAFPETWGASKR